MMMKGLLKGIESLKQRSIDEVKQKFHHLLSQYQREKEKVKEKVKVQFDRGLEKRRDLWERGGTQYRRE